MFLVAPDDFDLNLNMDEYSIGDRVNVSCSSGSSNPVSTMQLLVDGDPVVPVVRQDGANNGIALYAATQFVAEKRHHGLSVVCQRVYDGNPQEIISKTLTVNRKFVNWSV